MVKTKADVKAAVKSKQVAGKKGAKKAGGESGWVFPDDVAVVPIPTQRCQSGYRGVGVAGDDGGYSARVHWLDGSGRGPKYVGRLPASQVTPKALYDIGMQWSQAMANGNEAQQQEYVKQYRLGVKNGRIPPAGCIRKRSGKRKATDPPATEQVAR